MLLVDRIAGLCALTHSESVGACRSLVCKVLIGTQASLVSLHFSHRQVCASPTSASL